MGIPPYIHKQARTPPTGNRTPRDHGLTTEFAWLT
jgi:hypothetical protein